MVALALSLAATAARSRATAADKPAALSCSRRVATGTGSGGGGALNEQADVRQSVSTRMQRQAGMGNQMYDGTQLALMFLMLDRCNPLKTL